MDRISANSSVCEENISKDKVIKLERIQKKLSEIYPGLVALKSI